MVIALVCKEDGWHIEKRDGETVKTTKRGRYSRLSALCDYLELEDEKQGERL